MTMSRKDTRLFARFDLDYADHPKIGGLSDAAFRAHVEMILYSRKYLTDGLIPKRLAKRFGSDSLSELLANDPVSPSLSLLDDGSYLLHGYSDMNDTKEDVERRTRANRENGRLGGLAKKRTASKPLTEPLTETLSEIGSENVAETETETETEVRAKALTTRERGPDLDALFDTAYSHWPKKVERKKSLDAFKRAARRRDPHKLADDIRTFGTAYAATTPTQFVPALVVWINGERWTDELPQPRQDGAHARAHDRQAENLAAVQRAALEDLDRQELTA